MIHWGVVSLAFHLIQVIFQKTTQYEMESKSTSRKCGFVLPFVVAYYPTRLAMVVSSHLAKLANMGDLKLKIGICSRAI